MFNLKGIDNLCIEFKVKEGYLTHLYYIDYAKTGVMYDTVIYEMKTSRDIFWDETRQFISEDTVKALIKSSMDDNLKIFVTYQNDDNDISRCKVIDDYINQRFAE
jgi:hypothetical protein